MTDLINLTKTELNALLVTPLNASALKKTSKADLVAMFDAMSTTDALDADLRDARADDTPPTEPTLGQVIDGLTPLEKAVVVAHLDAGMDCNGAETLDAMRADNMTWSDVAETSKRTGLTKKQVNGVLSSLSTKGLVVVDCDPVNGEGPVQQVLSDEGIVVAFELLADGVEAKATIKPKKPTPAPKAERKARVLKAHVYCQPVAKPEQITSLKAGSKKHLLAQALLGGATMDELMAATGWKKDVVSSAFQYDMKNSGFGVERRDDQKYYLLMPKGLKVLPVMAQGQTRADALVAACR
ncbi:hypothetical protein [Roseovarius sp. MBR-6]|jgi:hypothetical protein|uniref:hypothetical protein n=1 Tax=Roseovarius sp. MBR-6 TaxID=3156459 RepID=UPI003393DF03